MSNEKLYHLKVQSMDLDTLVKVADQAREKTTDTRWLNAISQAYDFLLTSDEIVEIAEDGTAMIPSATGLHRYSANGVCQCSAFYHNNPCWHRAASRLITRYKEALEAEADFLMNRADELEQRGDDAALDRLMKRWSHVELKLMEVSG